jgi:hypothetical protein
MFSANNGDASEVIALWGSDVNEDVADKPDGELGDDGVGGHGRSSLHLHLRIYHSLLAKGSARGFVELPVQLLGLLNGRL